MVDTLNHRSLVALSNSMALPPVRRETYENQTAKLTAAKPNSGGLDVENQISTPVEAELFS